jgi:tetratricopeptide (TPR) repeat protein
LNLQRNRSIELLQRMVLAGVCLGAGLPLLPAQSAPPASNPAPSQTPGQAGGQAGGQQDNPFPGEAPKAAGQKGASQQDSTPDKPKSGSDNPFPGEDTNAPIIPVDPGPGSIPGAGRSPDAGSGSGSGGDSAASSRRDADPDGDPVRSPDGLAHTVDDPGFSSSRNGLNQMPAEDDSDGRPGKSTKNKSREEVIKEDLDVGGFYSDRKNWKAAQARFSSAFGLDSENPEAIWGLAEAERHLQLYKEAAEHYKLLLSYDPDGPHHREARKDLEEVEAARPSASAASRPTGTENN